MTALVDTIPPIRMVTGMNDIEALSLSRSSWLHSLLVAGDMTLGWFLRRLRGSMEPDITISSRIALSVMSHQIGGVTQPSCPKSILLTAYVLERIQPGHLNSAILADWARGRRIQMYLTAIPAES